MTPADPERAFSPNPGVRAPRSQRRATEKPIDLGRIACVTGGRVDGDCAFIVTALSSLEKAGADSLSFYAGPKRAAKLKTSGAGAVMLKAEHAGLFPGHKVIVEDPYAAYARASALFAPPPGGIHPGGIHPSAVIAAGASLHADVTVGPYSVIGDNSRLEQGVVVGSHVSVGGDCVLGRHTVVEPGVCIYPRTVIGRRCRLASGAVIGASGFGYAPTGGQADGGGAWLRIEQLGGVVIGDDVDIGAHTAIDRGALDDTVIGNGVKLDNHIQIAHNVRVGDHTIMAGCVAIAGSTVIGARCQLGGRASILGHLQIADDVRVNAGSFVARSITEAGVYSSMIPALPAARWRNIAANLRRLDRLAEKVKKLRGDKPT